MTVVGLLPGAGSNQHNLCGTRPHMSPLSHMDSLPSTALLSLVCRIWGADTLTPLLAAQRCQQMGLGPAGDHSWPKGSAACPVLPAMVAMGSWILVTREPTG